MSAYRFGEVVLFGSFVLVQILIITMSRYMHQTVSAVQICCSFGVKT